MTVYTQANQNKHLSQCLPSCEKSVIYSLRSLPTIFKLWVARTRQRRHLARLDDRMLADIGLSRADANQEISKPFWR